jgi:hypothetical protein
MKRYRRRRRRIGDRNAAARHRIESNVKSNKNDNKTDRSHRRSFRFVLDIPERARSDGRRTVARDVKSV